MTKGRVAIIYGRPDPDAPADEKDTLVQAGVVRSALEELGWEAADVPVSLDLAFAKAELERLSPRFAFNLAESLQGKGRLIAVVPALLESMRIPFTGAPADAIFLTSNKILGKRLLAMAGISTPPWATGRDVLAGSSAGFPSPFIIKSVWEHASIGMDDKAVAPDLPTLTAELAGRAGVEDLFVESYIPGREFNMAFLGGPGEPFGLPPAEIEFVDFPEGKPKVVGYKAKWMEGSFESVNTPRRLDFPSSDRPLLAELDSISRSCWRLFGLRGYARVDFRVDGAGRAMVLEINTNPCIAPDSGFMAAAGRAGLGIRDVVERIVAECLQ